MGQPKVKKMILRKLIGAVKSAITGRKVEFYQLNTELDTFEIVISNDNTYKHKYMITFDNITGTPKISLI